MEMAKVLQLITAINSERDYYRLLDTIISGMRSLTHCDAGTLYVVQEGMLHFTIMHNETLGAFQTAENNIDLPPVSLGDANNPNENNVCAYAAVHKELINIADVYSSERFNFNGPKEYDGLTGYRTQSMVVFPLTNVDEAVVGVLQLINAKDENGRVIPFNPEWQDALQSLASIAAIALTNIKYTEDIKKLFHSMVHMLTRAIDERSPYNAYHTVNVARYVGRFVDYLQNSGTAPQFDAKRKEQIVMAANLHDIGKILTPLSVMDKPDRLGSRLRRIEDRFELKRWQIDLLQRGGVPERNSEEHQLYEQALRLIHEVNSVGFISPETQEKVRCLAELHYLDAAGQPVPLLLPEEMECLSIVRGTLTDAERGIIQQHVGYTANLLDQIEFGQNLKDVPIWAAGHHEFIDGTGYPHGLKGTEVTTEMRILTIVDIFDALIAKRPYKHPMPPERASEVLRSMVREGKLDETLVEAFIESRVWELE